MSETYYDGAGRKTVSSVGSGTTVVEAEFFLYDGNGNLLMVSGSQRQPDGAYRDSFVAPWYDAADVTPIGSAYELSTGSDIITGEDLQLSSFEQGMNVADVVLTPLPWVKGLTAGIGGFASAYPAMTLWALIGGKLVVGGYAFAGGRVQKADAGITRDVQQATQPDAQVGVLETSGKKNEKARFRLKAGLFLDFRRSGQSRDRTGDTWIFSLLSFACQIQSFPKKRIES